ncbi:MAG: flagellar basal body P-ring protein FlgI [Bryobacterales bacterium]|nr:flagellar basal body P-ring protein FlgI [Bryobacterales bacterium]
MKTTTKDRARAWALWLVIPILVLVAAAPGGAATRIKELAQIEGIRDNQLIGYGLVVGLAGTGDGVQTQFTVQTLRNMLDRMGISLPPAMLRVTNTAAVMITATLPPFAQPGGKVDVTVSAMGDASNLAGGVLLLTPLRGVSGEIYAVAQGPMTTGGFVAGRQGQGNATTRNHPTTARIPNGALVERAAPSVMPVSEVRLQLRTSDFANAVRIAEAINGKFAAQPPLAIAQNPGMVAVQAPENVPGGMAGFIAALEALEIDAEQRAGIVVNERTGTVIVGSQVRVAPVVMMHGTLSIEIQTRFDVSQPAPFGKGETTVVPEVNVAVREEEARSVSLKEGATVDDLVRALNTIGVTPRDIIAILQSLKAAGALDVDLQVI